MLSPIVQKVKSKVGSDLGATEVECFNKSYLPAADFAAYVQPSCQYPEAYEYVHHMVLEYTQDMIVTAQMNPKEEQHIQPPTFKLLQDLVKHFLPALGIEFFEKSVTGTVEIGYKTYLTTSRGVVTVTGETDLLICVGGVPVGNVEVENVTMHCNTPNEIGEILAEDKGFAERHKQRVGVEPRLFPSVLVSGQTCVFVDRSFREGGDQYLVFPALVTFDIETAGKGKGAADYKVDEQSVEMVSRMLMRMMHAMEKLIKAISTTRKRVYDVYAASEDTEEEGDEGDEPDDEDPPAPGKGPSATDKPTATAAAGKCAKGGGGRGGGGGEKRVPQSDLTMVNMYRHDLDILWHRTVLL